MDREWWWLRLHVIAVQQTAICAAAAALPDRNNSSAFNLFSTGTGTYNVNLLDKYKEEQCDNNFFILVTAFLVVVCSVGTFWDEFGKKQQSALANTGVQAKAQVYSFEATLRNRIARLLMQRMWVAGKAS